MRPMGLQGRRVLLCVGGGIAAYKACELARLLVKDGAQVRVALTPAAQRFVTALTFQALTGSAVAADIFSAEQELAAGHIALADWAELAVVAPATANLLARLRIGQADDAAAAALLAIDPRRWLLAPAMNEKMWASPAVEENVRVLRERGARMVGPAIGDMVEVVSAEDLARAVGERLDGVRVVVMAAAVADQRPSKRASQKVKKKPGDETVTLVRTPDILASLGERAQRPLLVGFAAETENVEGNARDKLLRKNLDLIVANDVADAFGKTTNKVLVLGKDGARRELAGPKQTVAYAIWDMVRERLSR